MLGLNMWMINMSCKNADIVLKYNSKLLFMLYIESIEVLDFHITSASHRTVFGN